MIAIRQTRRSVDSLGNCFEACIASILEVALSSVPDRIAYLGMSADEWADLVQRTARDGGLEAVGDLKVDLSAYDRALIGWLGERGLGLLELEIGGKGGISEEEFLDLVVKSHPGYWIANFAQDDAGAMGHAIVMLGRVPVHDPYWPTAIRKRYGRLQHAWIITAADPALTVRRLAADLLPRIPAGDGIPIVADESVERGRIELRNVAAGKRERVL